MPKLKSAAFAVSAVLLGMSMSTLASADEAAPSQVVHYNPSQLDTSEGVRHLYSRLVLAAEKVCPRSDGTRLLNEAVVECRKQAIAGAVEKIHNSRLAALSSSRSHTG